MFTKITVKFRVSASAALRAGSGCPTEQPATLEIEPAKLSQEERNLLADHLDENSHELKCAGKAIIASSPTVQAAIDEIRDLLSAAEQSKRQAQAETKSLIVSGKRISSMYGDILYLEGEDPWHHSRQRTFDASDPDMIAAIETFHALARTKEEENKQRAADAERRAREVLATIRFDADGLMPGEWNITGHIWSSKLGLGFSSDSEVQAARNRMALQWIATYGTQVLRDAVELGVPYEDRLEEEYVDHVIAVRRAKRDDQFADWSMWDEEPESFGSHPKRSDISLLRQARKAAPGARLGKINGATVAWIEFRGQYLIWPPVTGTD